MKRYISFLLALTCFLFAGCAGNTEDMPMSQNGMPHHVYFEGLEEYAAFMLASESDDAKIDYYLQNAGNSFSMNGVHDLKDILVVREVVERIPLPKAEGMQLRYMSIDFASRTRCIEEELNQGMFYQLEGEDGRLHISTFGSSAEKRLRNIKKNRREFEKISTANPVISELWYKEDINSENERICMLYAVAGEELYEIRAFDAEKTWILDKANNMQFVDIAEELKNYRDAGAMIFDSIMAEMEGLPPKIYVRASIYVIEPYVFKGCGKIWDGECMVMYDGPTAKEMLPDLAAEGKLENLVYYPDIRAEYFSNVAWNGKAYVFDESFEEIAHNEDISMLEKLGAGTYYVSLPMELTGEYIEEADEWEEELIECIFKLTVE